MMKAAAFTLQKRLVGGTPLPSRRLSAGTASRPVAMAQAVKYDVCVKGDPDAQKLGDCEYLMSGEAGEASPACGHPTGVLDARQ